MRTVWKYKLALNESIIVMPVDAIVLSVDLQGESICLWALVDPEEKQVEARCFLVAGTGHTLPEDDILFFYGTVQLLINGQFLVCHVFELAIEE